MFVEASVPQWVPPPGSFDTVVRAVLALRKGNPALVSQHNKSLQYSVIENEVDEFNAARCMAHGWTSFVQADGAGPPQPSFLPPQRLRPVVAAATSLKRTAAVGVAMIRDMWLGDSLKPVEPALAEKRAMICVDCPQHGDPNLIERLAGEVANTIRLLLQTREDMDLKTSVDSKLQTCKACGCFLKLKVHTKLDFVQKTMKAEDRAKLDHRCWALNES